MKVRQIFEIVKSLDQGQKSALTRFVKSNTSSKSQLEMLYDRIRTTRVLNSKTEAKIRGKDFNDSRAFYQYRVALMDLIIRGLVQINNSKSDPFEYIKAAVSLEANVLASRVLLQELEKGLEENKTGYVTTLLELKNDLEFEFRVKFDLGSLQVPSVRDVGKQFANEITLRGALDQVRIGLGSEPGSWERRATEIEKEVSNVPQGSPKVIYLSLKVKVGVHLLRNEYGKAGELQDRIIRMVLDQKISLPIGAQLREFSTYIHYSLYSGTRSKVSFGLMYLSKLETASPALEKLKTYSWITNAVFAAETFSDLDLAKRVLPELVHHRSGFQVQEWVKMVYFLSIVHLYQQEFKAGIKCLMFLNNIPKPERGKYTWQPTLLLVVFHFGLGNLDVVESLLNQAKSDIKNSLSEFPKIVYLRLRKLFSVYGSFSFKEELVKTYQVVKTWEENNPDDLSPVYFNFSLWLESQITGLSMGQLELDHPQPVKSIRAKIS